MDIFTEKELVDCLKSMAVSLRNIDRKLDDIALSLREISTADGDDCADCGDVVVDVEESIAEKEVESSI